MPNPLILKRSAVAGKVPLTTDLQLGELAYNTNDGRLFAKKNAGSDNIVEFLTGDSAFKPNVRAATTANITLSGTQTIDGVAVVSADRVLVKDQTTAADNGIYIVASGAWTRVTDANAAAELAGAVVAVARGTVNGGKIFKTTFTAANVLGTDAMTWTEFGAGGGGGASVTVSGTAPSSPSNGDLWWDTESGDLLIYYSDGTSAQWVAATSNGGGNANSPFGPGGSDGQIQYRASGAFAGAANVEIDSSFNLSFVSLSSKPAAPATNRLQLYARRRAGADWLEMQRPNGREMSLQPHLGLNFVGLWTPSSGTTVNTLGIPRTGVGTVSHPALATTNLSTSRYRWRNTSAATANSVADEWSAQTCVWRGNAAGLGGFTFVTRINLATLAAASVGFFGLANSVAAFSTTQTIAALTSVVGIGFTNGTNTNWQVITNDITGAPVLTDMGSNFPVSSTTNVYTLIIYAPINGSSIWVRVIEEVSGNIFDQEFSADIPAAATFLAPRLFLHNGGAASAVAYDCSGLYLERDI